MKISLIAAISNNHIIGQDNQLLWKLSGDMKHFRTTTTGHTIIMGRKTFESFGSKALPNRTNIIVSRNTDYDPTNEVVVVLSVKSALNLARFLREEEVFIIGGGEIYAQTIDLADKLIITHVDLEVEGDTVFPHIGLDNWTCVSKTTHLKDEKNQYDFSICDYKRINNS